MCLSVFHGLYIKEHLKFFEQQEKKTSLHAIVAGTICVALQGYLLKNPRLPQILSDAEVFLGLLFDS